MAMDFVGGSSTSARSPYRIIVVHFQTCSFRLSGGVSSTGKCGSSTAVAPLPTLSLFEFSPECFHTPLFFKPRSHLDVRRVIEKARSIPFQPWVLRLFLGVFRD